MLARAPLHTQLAVLCVCVKPQQGAVAVSLMMSEQEAVDCIAVGLFVCLSASVL